MVMDNRFCSPRHWSQSTVRPRCPMNDGGNAQNHKTAARATPKVVQIPVRFVNSEPSRPDSAIKIQKVFRGFLIRSRVKKILELKEEADKIEDRMSRGKIVELIQKDQRERLRINEMLMSLLFKLDSICSVDAGVRVCRKAVIKKVISLQERLDSIADPSQTGESQNNVSPAEVVDSALSNIAVESNQNLLDNEIQDSENNLSAKEPDPEICSAEDDDLGIKKAAGICEGDGEKGQSDTKSYTEENYDTSRDEFEDAIDSGMKAKSEEDTNVVTETTGENQNIMNTTTFVSECMEETMWTHSAADKNEVSEKTMEEENGGQKKEDEEMNNQQVLKRLMEDNQTMMNMMTQLFERNEMQTQMLNTLRNKVELLEKAFVCDRMRKKKKRHSS